MARTQVSLFCNTKTVAEVLTPAIFLLRFLFQKNKGVLGVNSFCRGDALTERDVPRLETMDGETPNRVSIRFQFHDTPLGKMLIASTHTGICYLGFAESENSALKDLERRYPSTSLVQRATPLHDQALDLFFSGNFTEQTFDALCYHVKATQFQRDVWQTLLTIPFGEKCSYGELAAEIGKPGASRAVGTAIGQNPISLLIPCHRVIRCNGDLGGYFWGMHRKVRILDWEASHRA